MYNLSLSKDIGLHLTAPSASHINEFIFFSEKEWIRAQQKSKIFCRIMKCRLSEMFRDDVLERGEPNCLTYRTGTKKFSTKKFSSKKFSKNKFSRKKFSRKKLREDEIKLTSTGSSTMFDKGIWNWKLERAEWISSNVQPSRAVPAWQWWAFSTEVNIEADQFRQGSISLSQDMHPNWSSPSSLSGSLI